MRIITFNLMAVFVAAGAAAQTSDLGIQKAVVTQPSAGGGTGTYAIVVTNYGPQTAQPPILVSDHIPAPGFFTGSVAAPWTCTPPLSGNPTAISCQYNAPLAAGQATPPLTLTAGVTNRPASVQNCAMVEAHVKDPNTANNRDCACMDFKGCRAVTIDLSTGVSNGAALATGATDPNWTVGAAPVAANASGPTAYVNPHTATWVSGLPAQWITPKPSANATNVHPTFQTLTDQGDYDYRFTFTLGPDWQTHPCRLRFQYAADNRVSFSLDGNAPFATSANNVFGTLQPQVIAPVAPAPGRHVLLARVHNDSGPTGLLVRGVVECTCRTFIDVIPNPTNPATTATQ